MNTILMLLMTTLFFNQKALANDCDKHKVYCKIIELQPRLDTSYAMRLSNLIYKNSIKYNIDPMLSVAILNQESSLRNINSVVEVDKVSTICDDAGDCKQIKHGTKYIIDMSIAQININSVSHYGLDAWLLFKLDLAYSIEAHFIVLSSKMKLCTDMEHSWACYHSKTPKYREAYIKAVSRYLTID